MKIFESFFTYAKERSFGRLFLDLVLLSWAVTWTTGLILFATHFNTITTLFEQYINSPSLTSSQHVSDNEFRRNVMLNANIDNELYRLIEDTNAQRAHVSRFHNGKVGIHGMHFLYYSRTHEVAASGISHEFGKNQNTPLSFVNDFNKEYLNRNCVAVDDVNNLGSLSFFYKEQGVSSLIACPIYMTGDKLIGFIGIDYIYNFDQKRKDEYLIELQNTASRIGGMLSISNEK